MQTRVLEDSVQGSLLQLAVKRHDEKDRLIGMPQAHVAAALPEDLPAEPFEYRDKLCARDDR